MPAINFLAPGCCCGSTPPPPCLGTLVFDVTACGNPACLITVTITQTSGGTYSASMSGSSPITFPSIPCGTYSYSISATGATSITGSATVSSSSTTTVTASFGSAPTGYFCGCCPCRWFPETLFASCGLGSATMTWTGTEWFGTFTIASYPGFTWPGCTATTESLTVNFSLQCMSVTAGVATYQVTTQWIYGTGPGFPPPGYTIACLTGPCAVNEPIVQGGSNVDGITGQPQTVMNNCASPINISIGYVGGDCAEVPIGTVTITE